MLRAAATTAGSAAFSLAVIPPLRRSPPPGKLPRWIRWSAAATAVHNREVASARESGRVVVAGGLQTVVVAPAGTGDGGGLVATATFLRRAALTKSLRLH